MVKEIIAGRTGNGFMDEWDNFKQFIMSLGDDLHDL